MQLTKRFWTIKYIAEWIIDLILILFISPLFLLIILFQQVFDSGPIFYISDRIGKGGRVFKLYKFRSMKVGSIEIRANDNKVITVKNDSRITKFGSLLRLGFDELPQLINVLKGDMSLIGPRPDIPEEKLRYNDREKIRLNVLPGITGLTQVLDGRTLSNKDNYELDVRYVLYSSILIDIKILILTIPYSLGLKKIGRKILNGYMYDINL